MLRDAWSRHTLTPLDTVTSSGLHPTGDAKAVKSGPLNATMDGCQCIHIPKGDARIAADLTCNAVGSNALAARYRAYTERKAVGVTAVFSYCRCRRSNYTVTVACPFYSTQLYKIPRKDSHRCRSD